MRRGGSWFFDLPEDLRASARYRGEPDDRDFCFGFRCVRGSRPQPAPPQAAAGAEAVQKPASGQHDRAKEKPAAKCTTDGVAEKDRPEAAEYCNTVETAWSAHEPWRAEERFRQAERIRQATPGIRDKYSAISRDLAEHCRERRIQEIGLVSSRGNCRYACRLVAEGLRFYPDSNVGHYWLVLDEADAMEVLGECLKADATPCALVRKKIGSRNALDSSE